MSLLAELQKQDTHIGPIYQKLQQKMQLDELYVGESRWETKKLAKMIEHLQLRDDGRLTAQLPIRGRRQEVVVCLGTKRREVIHKKHEMAHLGVIKTTVRVMIDWLWPGMTADIRRFVLGCQIYQQSKAVKTKTAGERQHLFRGRPWQQVSVDLWGPFPKMKRGNTQILVLTDHFTRWVDAIRISDGKAETIATTLDECVFQYFDVPETVHSNHSSQFEVQLLKKMCRLWGKRGRALPTPGKLGHGET